MGRLVVVSNRVGPLIDRGKAGGLAVALVDALREMGGVWFGWSGDISADGTFSRLKTEEAGDIRLSTIDITPEDEAEFYAGYANKTLWPILHYRLDLAIFDRQFDTGYQRVNQRFATRLTEEELKPDDTIWVHDYQFFAVGSHLRALGVENPIGFFLHIPFPGPEILTALPNADELLDQLMSYDVVGFQTRADRDNFGRCVVEMRNGRDDPETSVVSTDRYRAVARAFPIGIDAKGFAGYAVTDEARQHERRLEALLGDRVQIIGVDRIDYSKGLPERFRAFEQLLEKFPENLGRVSFMQVAPPSRSDVDAYADIRHELEHLAGHVNGRFADLDWTPIRFMTRSFARRALAGVYRKSAVGMVTPLRDGMNLVAKEYVAAQNPRDPGVLVLSQFAGAAEEMNEALIVNPYSPESVAEVLQEALHMNWQEKTDRWNALFERITTNDATSWRNDFLGALEDARGS